MLDVHPPHAPTHTWRDFLTHIATIVCGLLIAVGLEQSVEAIHHAHQRRELREALHRDTEINTTWAKENVDHLDLLRHWAIDRLGELERAGPTGILKMHRMPQNIIWVPNTGVWLSAKQNGEVSLLTASEQNWYEDTYRVENNTFVAPAGPALRMFDAQNQMNGLLINRYTVLPSGELDLSDLNAAERLRLNDCLRNVIEASRLFESANITYGSYTEYLLTTSSGQFEQSYEVQRAMSIYNRNMAQHPDLELAF
jgi:hypothetical protein